MLRHRTSLYEWCGTSYLGLDSINELICKTESVLSILRESLHPIDESIIEWLLRVKDQMEVWADEMELGLKSFTKVNPKLLNEINLTKESKKPSELIKEMKLLYSDVNTERSTKIVTVLQKLLNKVVAVNSQDSLKAIAGKKENSYDIAILNSEKENFKYIDTLQATYPDIAIVVVFNKINSSTLLKLGLKGISNTLTNPIKGVELKRELLNIAQTYHSNRRLLINNKKIFNFISDLQPLPNTLLQIQQVCDDEEITIKELIAVVKMDPVITGILLKAATSPMYGLKSVSTIDNAVSAFGKKTVKALAMSELSQYMGVVNLKAYQSCEETFSLVSKLRLSLMVAWYSKVSIAELSVLSTTAILGNLGQLLISKEISSANKEKDFYEQMRGFGVQIAEEQYLHTTTAFVTSDILGYWQLSNEVVDSIRYSDNPMEAPLEIRNLAIANHIVFNIIKLDGTFLDEITDEMYYIMSEEDLDPTIINKAIKTVKQNIG